MRVHSLLQVGSKQGGGGCTLKIAKSVLKKFDFFVGYVAYRLGWANHDRQFEECFSKPEDLDWLENKLKEDRRKMDTRQRLRTTYFLKKHGRAVSA